MKTGLDKRIALVVLSKIGAKTNRVLAGVIFVGFLLSFFLDTAGGGWWFTLFTAILGSVILLWVLGKVRKS